MVFEEYGKENSRTVLLLHGGGLGPWSCADAARNLGEHFRVIVPTLDGHGGADAPFCGITENASRLIEYIDSELGGKVALISGLSLGGQILLEALSKRPDICDFAIIESASVIPTPAFIRSLLKPSVEMSYPLISKRWFALLQFRYLRIRDDLFEDYYADTSRIDKNNMTAFIDGSIAYSLPLKLSEVKARTIVVAGGREMRSVLKSAEMISSAIPSSTLEVKKGLRHGEWSINKTTEYSEYIKALLSHK